MESTILKLLNKISLHFNPVSYMKFTLAIIANFIASAIFGTFFEIPWFDYALFPFLIAIVLHVRPSSAFLAAFLGQVALFLLSKFSNIDFLNKVFIFNITETNAFGISESGMVYTNVILVGIIAGFFAIGGTAVRQTQVIMAKVLFVIYSGVYFFFITPALVAIALYARFFVKKKKMNRTTNSLDQNLRAKSFHLLILSIKNKLSCSNVMRTQPSQYLPS